MPKLFEGAKVLSKRTYLAILLAGLGGSLALAVVTPLFAATASKQPPTLVYLIAGLIGLVVTAVILSLAANYEPSLKRRLLWLVFLYNGFIVLVKLVLAPLGLYMLNSNEAFDAGSADPNSLLFYVLAGLLVFALYFLAWYIIYRVYHRRVARRLLSASPVGTSTNVAAKRRISKPLAISLTVLALAAFIFSGAWVLLLFLAFGGLSYLGLVFTSPFTLPIVASLAAAIMLAIGAFRQAEDEAVELGNATVLAGLFWLGLMLILLYHVLWVVFLMTLVTTWPFNTYTPK